MKKIIDFLMIIFSLCLLGCKISKPKTINALEIISIYDGDTFNLKNGSKVRLFGIDAPELIIRGKPTIGKEQLAARMAKEKLLNIVKNKKISMQIITKDKYNRIIARLWANNQDINLFMISSGFARVAYINNNPKSVYRTFNEKYLDKLLWAQKKAYDEQLFIWKKPQNFFQIFSKIKKTK